MFQQAANCSVRNREPADKTQPTSCQLSVQTYWDSPEARNLFGSQNGDENALVTINQKITIKWLVIVMLLKAVICIMFVNKYRFLRYDNAVLSCAWCMSMHEKK